MYKSLFLIVIGVVLGILIGSTGIYFMLEGKLGDSYEIVKPKIKGDSNNMHIDQENLKKIDNKSLKWKKNGKLRRKYRKSGILPGEAKPQ